MYPISRYVIEPVEESPTKRRRIVKSPTNAAPRRRRGRRRRCNCGGRRRLKTEEGSSRGRGDADGSARRHRSSEVPAAGGRPAGGGDAGQDDGAARTGERGESPQEGAAERRGLDAAAGPSIAAAGSSRRSTRRSCRARRRRRCTTLRHRYRSSSRRRPRVRRPSVALAETPDEYGDSGHAVRCSANVVLLAHEHRSLHVLVVQRSQLTAADVTVGRHRVRPSLSAVVVRYKLPGGQLIMTDDEQDAYKLEDRHACTCPDDQRWYTAALDRVMALSPQAQAATTPAALMADEYQLLLRRQFVLLGKWYRTQDKAGREHIKWTADHHHHHHRRDHYNNHHGDGHCGTGAAADIDSNNNNNNNPQCYYYPYKPAHVSRQTVEQKRVYAAPDAGALFSGDPPSSFRLRTPRPKIRTVRRPDGMTATVITTYKCKFVPLPRLHENTRTYGPVLSSLPVVLSSMNLICLP